jgi:isopenicillin-N epimerase
VVPPAVSWEDPDGFPTAVEHGGTLDYGSWLAAPAGLHLLRTLDPDRVRRHGIEMATYGQKVLANALGTTAPEGSPGVTMRLVPLPPGTADDHEASQRLRTRIATELRCEVAAPSWGGHGYLRVSGAAYNRPEHYDRLAQALPALIR